MKHRTHLTCHFVCVCSCYFNINSKITNVLNLITVILACHHTHTLTSLLVLVASLLQLLALEKSAYLAANMSLETILHLLIFINTGFTHKKSVQWKSSQPTNQIQENRTEKTHTWDMNKSMQTLPPPLPPPPPSLSMEMKLQRNQAAKS